MAKIISSKIIAVSIIIILLLASIITIDLNAASKPSKVKGLKVIKVTQTSVVLSWKKAKRAKKYIVYQKKGSTFKKIKKTKKYKITIKKLSPGKKYVFKVRGYNKKYGKFSKSIYVETKKYQRKKIPEGAAKVPELTVNGKTIKVGDSITSVNKKFKLEKSGLYDTGKYPWNIYEPYTDNFLMVRVKDGKVWGFYTSSRKFSCKSWDKTIKFGDSYSEGEDFCNDIDTDIQYIYYHTINHTVDLIYYAPDQGECDNHPNVSEKKQLAGAETIAEYAFNQLRYNEGKTILDTSQNTTAGKICKRWADDWIIKKSGTTHNGETTRWNFINEVIKKEFPDFIEVAPAEVCMGITGSGDLLGIRCGTIYAAGNSPAHYANVIKMTLDYNVLSISIGKDPGGKYEMHSIAAFI